MENLDYRINMDMYCAESRMMINRRMIRKLGIGPAALFSIYIDRIDGSDGWCLAADRDTAEELGVSHLDIRRYKDRLKELGVLRSKHDPNSGEELVHPEAYKALRLSYEEDG